MAHKLKNTSVLAFGVDAAYTSYGGELRAGLLEELELLAEMARNEGQPVPTRFSWFGETLHSHFSGGRSGWRFHLSNSAVDLFIGGRHVRQPPLQVQPKASALREMGLDRYIEWQRTHLQDWFTDVDAVEERPARVDLFVDVGGIDWDAFDLGQYRGQDGRWKFGCRNVRTFAGSVRGEGDIGGAEVWPVGDRRRGQSLYFGRRGQPIHLRVYDKTAEARLTEDSPEALAEVWRQAGWTGGRVLRFEFEVRREGLKQFVALGETVEGAERWAALGDWDDLRPRLNGIWRYLVLRWWRFVRPMRSRHADRGRVAWWDALAELEMLGGMQVPVARVRQRQGTVRQLQRQVAGLVATLAALEGQESWAAAIDEVAVAVEREFKLRPWRERLKNARRRYATKLPVEWFEWQKRKNRPNVEPDVMMPNEQEEMTNGSIGDRRGEVGLPEQGWAAQTGYAGDISGPGRIWAESDWAGGSERSSC